MDLAVHQLRLFHATKQHGAERMNECVYVFYGYAVRCCDRFIRRIVVGAAACGDSVANARNYRCKSSIPFKFPPGIWFY